MKNYDHKKIEKKWQKEWETQGLYKTQEDSILPKHYVLDMFPYPSGEGLHVGHPRGYIATDVYSRMKRMSGFNVLHPMGWDAFGLPAENFAIKNKVHPRIAVEKNVARFKEQLSLIGFDYDWSREINTTDPDFYKWTQWIFLQMFKKGLAFESFEPINWCPSCQTGLANEDVEADDTCERCGTPVEQKPMRQWVLKITDYADRMLNDLDKLPNWPDGVKEAQRNWIGRKEGVVISHKVVDSDIALEAFSAYPAWLYADTFIVIAPEHPIVQELIKNIENKKEIESFIEDHKKRTKSFTDKEKKGIFTGMYVTDPINKTQMPIWLANFALMDFGTGIIRCSSHDLRDYDFAKKYNIPLKEVVARIDNDAPVDAHENSGVLIDSGKFTGRNIDQNLIKEMVDYFCEQGFAKIEISYKIKDWVFSRQRYWGEPIPIIHCDKCGAVAVPEDQLPVLLPEVDSYEPTGTGESPLANIKDWVNTECPKCKGPSKRETNTMPQWAGSSWYYLRYIDPKNSESLISKEKDKAWMPVDVYVGGDHATRHLIYARFWHKFLFDIGVVSHEEPFPRLEFLGFILASDGRKMSKRWGNIVNPDDVVQNFGADSFRLYEMFIGPFEGTVPWNNDGLVGTSRFLERLWRFANKIIETKLATNTNNEIFLHKTIKKVTEDIESFNFNTAISSMMICLNEFEKSENVSVSDFKIFLQILAPFAPHITEELWYILGETKSIHKSSWPNYNPQKLISDTVKIAIQVNGKVRDEVLVAVDESDSILEKKAIESEKAKIWIDGKNIKKIIVVKNRLVNIVV